MIKVKEKYKDLSIDELIKYIEEMEEVIKNMRKEKNEKEILNFPWIGNLGSWNWMIKRDKVVFNEKKITNLGYTSEEIPEEVGFDFFTSILHPDDYERVMENMRDHLNNESEAFEVEYRIRTKNGDYAWYYDRGTVTKRDEEGEAIVMSGIVFDISKNKIMEKELKETNEKLKKLSITDELTSAFNKRYMYEKLNNKINCDSKNKTPFSMVMLDVDNFKFINDNYGHNVGDKVLKKISELVMNRIRSTDTFARVGGDEFMILLPNTKISNAVILAEDIKKQLNNTSVDQIDSIKASIGVTDYTDYDCVEAIIKKVDDLMYTAKAEGRNCVKY